MAELLLDQTASNASPIARSSAAARRDFLRDEWIPYLEQLRGELVAVAGRTVAGCAAAERATEQARLEQLSARCWQLTHRWHGWPNLSAFYEFFIEMSSIAGDQAFNFQRVPVQWSDDGFLFFFDSSIRAGYIQAAAATTGDTTTNNDDDDAAADAELERMRQSGQLVRSRLMTSCGDVVQTAGESAIDNTVLPNVLTVDESRVLLVGGVVKRFLIRMIAARQRRLLRRLLPDDDDASAEQRRARLRSLADTPDGRIQLDSAHVDPAQLSFRLLARSGCLLTSWGQLPPAVQRLWNAKLTILLSPQSIQSIQSIQSTQSSQSTELIQSIQSTESIQSTQSSHSTESIQSTQSSQSTESIQSTESTQSSHSIDSNHSTESIDRQRRGCTERYSDFIQFLHDHPGRWFENNKSLHCQLLVSGLLSNRLSLVGRSSMEQHTAHRHFRFRWRRQIPLVRCCDDGPTRRRLVVVRAAGTAEHSRLRANRFPYAYGHGISLSSGGLSEQRRTLQFEAGAALPADPDGLLGNWYLTDVEKIAVECELLNPRLTDDGVDEWEVRGLASRLHQRLPGEQLHDVGQNPKAGSSIGATQHTHMSRCDGGDVPLLALRNEPVWCDELAAFVDVVQVGRSRDAFFLAVRTKRPAAAPLLGFLHDLRVALLLQFGERAVDFNFYAAGTASGWHCLVFAPVEHDAAVVRSRVDPQLFPAGVSLGFSNGKGGLGYRTAAAARRYQRAGFETLAHVYDACRLVGSRLVTRAFLLDRLGYADRQGQVIPPPLVPHKNAHPPHDPVFGFLEPDQFA